ncbi:MAG: hypothetical protein HC782_04450 [Gammaproteobacteria bacterium]|nr:hypothetical protein [Gammaproteobacteria bacterium]
MSLELQRIKRTDERILKNMHNHYSQPKGFVGRNICYAVLFDKVYYGAIVAGSATRFLPGRNDVFGNFELNEIINNIFFHIEPVNERYPIRNFSQLVLKQFRWWSSIHWQLKYGDFVKGFETLVEKPRTGQIYIRDGWKSCW